MLESKIKIEVPYTSLRYYLEAFGILGLITIWVYVGWQYAHLPSEIPTHFNAAGKPDDFGSKNSLLLLCAIVTVLHFMLFFIKRVPHKLNYLVTITPQNALYQYQIQILMLSWLNISLLLVFGGIVYQTVQTALLQTNGLGAYFLPFTFATVLIPVFWGLWAATKN
jgi:uncharacterized membrane protein